MSRFIPCASDDARRGRPEVLPRWRAADKRRPHASQAPRNVCPDHRPCAGSLGSARASAVIVKRELRRADSDLPGDHTWGRRGEPQLGGRVELRRHRRQPADGRPTSAPTTAVPSPSTHSLSVRNTHRSVFLSGFPSVNFLDDARATCAPWPSVPDDVLTASRDQGQRGVASAALPATATLPRTSSRGTRPWRGAAR